jgi:hypothetical protein
MFAYFFSLILLNVFISLVASNANISPNNTKAVKFRSHDNYEFQCLSKYYGTINGLVGGLRECGNTDQWQKFYIKNLEHINDKLKPNEYPITDVTWVNFWNNNETETVLENVRFEKFDDITWLIVNAYKGQQCLTLVQGQYPIIDWMDCGKKNNFPKNPTQRWDIENW